jgi:two-component system CheB/CheR fusion protein
MKKTDNKQIIPKDDTVTKTKRKNVVVKNDGSDFPIVGIGASAGGLEALEVFFKNTPKNPGMAFVVIQHLDPNYVGMLPELLQRVTSMQVVQATDMLKVQSNHVYVIPPNKSLTILEGVLHLFDPIQT